MYKVKWILLAVLGFCIGMAVNVFAVAVVYFFFKGLLT